MTGSDNSHEFLKHLVSKYHKGNFIELDAISLKTDKKYDGLYSNKVMHHLTDEQLTDSIKRQHEILNPNGIICHSFWHGNESEYFNGLFVNYHNETILTSVHEQYFEILYVEEYKEFDDNDSLLLLGRKNKHFHAVTAP